MARSVLTTAAGGRQIRRRHHSARASRRPRAPLEVPPRHHGWTPVRPAFPPRVGNPALPSTHSPFSRIVVPPLSMSSRVGNDGLEPANLRETSETGGGRERICGRKFWEKRIGDSGICEGMSW
ncbi:hypothetical protein VPH35_036458 [Triticum aestivum]|uniref:Uncharacterized protein n=1 Tax=Aegilops tauschii subsp. strangulata TaxID=200361 RepID=A0A453BCP5_AEGTS